MKRIFLPLFLFAALTCFNSAVHSQNSFPHWESLRYPFAAVQAPMPYFINTEVGFLFDAENAPGMLKTTDGGVNWRAVTSFDFASGDNKISSVYFVSPDHGYYAGNTGLYETTDTGSSWQQICKSERAEGYGFFTSVYASGNILYAMEQIEFGPQMDLYGTILALKSSDNGLHWDTINTPRPMGWAVCIGRPFPYIFFGNKENVVFVSVPDAQRQQLLFHSTNNGKDWSLVDLTENSIKTGLLDTTSNLCGNFSATTMGWYCTPHCSVLYRTYCEPVLANTNPPPYFIERSYDYGKTWEVILKPQKTIGAEIAGDGTAIFVSKNDNDTTEGFYRSNDLGNNWTTIHGHRFYNSYDLNFWRNFCVLNEGAVIYACDKKTMLWKTMDGGDGTYSSSSFSSTRFSSTRIINDSFNVMIHLPIYFHHSGTMSDVDMILHYPTTSLQLTSTTLYNGKSFDVNGSQWPGRAALHFAAADLNAAPDSLLGYANFRWTPFEYACDDIIFDSIDTHSTEAPCSGSSNAQPFKGIIGSYATCGLSGVAESELNNAPLDFSIHPNPARTSIQIEVANTPGKLQYEMFDELGIARRKGVSSENKFGIDLTGLAEGNYYLRIGSKEGVVVTKRMLVVK